MNKFQRAGSGFAGALEHVLDDLRHTWERFVYGRKVTGDVDMFPPPARQGAEAAPDTAALFDKLYGRTAERDGEQAPERGQGQERDAPGEAWEMER